MQEHRNLSARLNIILGWIGIAFSALAATLLFILYATALSGSRGTTTIRELTIGSLPGMTGLLAITFVALQLLFSITQLSGGKKLLAGEKGMTGLMIVSVVSLLAFPIGTIIGAYTIWVVTACKDSLVDPSTVEHPHAEQMAHEGITYNGRYYAVGEIHFDKLDDAFAYARQLKQRSINV